MFDFSTAFDENMQSSIAVKIESAYRVLFK